MTTTTQTFRALDFAFTLESDDPDLTRYVDEVFASLGDVGEGEAIPGRYTAEAGANGYTLRLGDRMVASSAGAERVVTLLTWHVTREALSALGDRVVLHAAAAEYGGRALLLPGPSGSGKSTLVAALVRRGLGYLTDELAVLDGNPARIRSFSKPLGLSTSPPPPLDDLAASPSPFESEARLVAPPALRPDCLGAPASPAWIVFPSYAGPGQPRLTPVRRAEALGLLGEQWVNAVEGGTGGFQALVTTVRDVPCWRLEAGDLGATCDAVLELLDR